MTKDFTVEALEKLILGDGGFIYDIANDMLANAKRNCPVVTGDLKNSIRYMIDPADMKIIMGSDNKYAGHVEYGTPTMESAHGKHDPKSPVTDWEAKRKKGKNQMATMPYLRPATFETQQNIGKFVPRRLKMKLQLIVR